MLNFRITCSDLDINKSVSSWSSCALMTPVLSGREATSVSIHLLTTFTLRMPDLYTLTKVDPSATDNMAHHWYYEPVWMWLETAAAKQAYQAIQDSLSSRSDADSEIVVGFWLVCPTEGAKAIGSLRAPTTVLPAQSALSPVFLCEQISSVSQWETYWDEVTICPGMRESPVLIYYSRCLTLI